MITRKDFIKRLIESGHWEHIYSAHYRTKNYEINNLTINENHFILGKQDKHNFSDNNIKLLIKLAKLTGEFNWYYF